MKLITVLSLILVSKLAGSALPTSPYIYSAGFATRSVDADHAALYIEVTGTGGDYNSALEKLKTESTSVFAILKAAQIPPGDIQSHEVSAVRRVQTGKIDYSIKQTINVVLRDLDRASEIVPQILAIGISTMQIGKPRSSKRKEIEQELTSEALREARARAEHIASQSGMRISSVYALSPIGFGQIEGALLPPERTHTPFPGGSSALTLRWPQINIEVSIHAIFLIERK